MNIEISATATSIDMSGNLAGVTSGFPNPGDCQAILSGGLAVDDLYNNLLLYIKPAESYITDVPFFGPITIIDYTGSTQTCTVNFDLAGKMASIVLEYAANIVSGGYGYSAVPSWEYELHIYEPSVWQGVGAIMHVPEARKHIIYGPNPISMNDIEFMELDQIIRMQLAYFIDLGICTVKEVDDVPPYTATTLTADGVREYTA